MKKSVKIPKEIGGYIIDEDSIIGKGSYGKIHFASRKNNSNNKLKIACKVISKKPLINLAIYNQSMMRETQEQFQREISFHQRLNDNKHIVKLYDFQQDKQAYYLFMEYCESDLGKLIQQRKKLSEAEAIEYIKQLCLGYSEIYISNASHRDLKPQNLLLQNGVLKIADFGFVKQLNMLTESITRSLARKTDKDKLRTSTLVGTPEYIPPNAIEIQSNSGIIYDPQKFDMWSIGIIFYYFIFGKRPFEGSNQNQLYNSIQNKSLVFPESTLISQHTKQIIKKLLNKNQQQRLQFRLLMKQLGLPYPSKDKRMKGFIERQKFNKGFPVIQEEVDQEKVRKVINNRIKYIQFINNLITMNAIFRRILGSDLRFKYYAYKLILRLHQLRLLKISKFQTQDYRNKVPSEICFQSKHKVSQVYQTINQFHRLFYDSIKSTCGLTEQPYQQLQYLLKCLLSRIRAMNQYECYDVDIIKMLMLTLGLESHIQKKLSLQKLLSLQNISEETKMCQQLSEFMK